MEKKAKASGKRPSAKEDDIQKAKELYKRKKLAERKRHAQNILEKQEDRRRGFVVKESEFVCNLQFHNKLPDIPFDPKFLNYPQVPNRFVQYRPTSLESEYVYQLHLEPHLGLPIDLIDSAKYEVPPTKPTLAPEDELMFSVPDDAKDSGKTSGKPRPTVSWLRKTEYMGNDLYDSVHKFKNEMHFQNERQRELEGKLHAHQDDLSFEDRVKKTFDELPQDDKIKHPTDKSRKVKKSWPVFPDESLFGNSYAMVTYDVLPQQDLPGDEKEKRQSQAIIRNVEQKDFSGGLSSLVGSLVVPEKVINDEEVEKFKYFREYQLDIKRTNEGEQFLFLLNPDAETVTFCELATRVELKKTTLGADEHRKRGASVKRRRLNDEEVKKQTTALKKVGSSKLPEEAGGDTPTEKDDESPRTPAEDNEPNSAAASAPVSADNDVASPKVSSDESSGSDSD